MSRSSRIDDILTAVAPSGEVVHILLDVTNV